MPHLSLHKQDPREFLRNYRQWLPESAIAADREGDDRAHLLVMAHQQYLTTRAGEDWNWFVELRHQWTERTGE